MDIEAGEHLIEMLVDNGWASEPSDLGRLYEHADDLAHIPRDSSALTGIGKGRVQRLLADIEQARSAPLAKKIVAACIAHVGAVAAEKIARQWPSLGELARADVTDLVRRTRINLEHAKAVSAWAMKEKP